MRTRRRWIAGLAAIALAGCVAVPASEAPTATLGAPPPGVVVDLSPRIAARPAGGDAASIARLPTVSRARTKVPVQVFDQPGGTALRGANNDQLVIDADIDVVVVGGPVVVDARDWYRVYAVPNASHGPVDFFAWIAAGPDGPSPLTDLVAVGCPLVELDIPTLAGLDPFTRARCEGAPGFELDGIAWRQALPVWYDVAPSWFGGTNGAAAESIFSLYAGPLRATGPDESGPSLDIQVPPDMTVPPFGFKIAVKVHFGDAASAGCRRSVGAVGDVPAEPAQDGAAWCATRLVLEQWTPLLGPESRPIDARAPQLHRHAGGGNVSCAGVGMSPLTFRIDPNAIDPVWLQAAGFSGRIIPSFGPTFRAAYVPELVVLDAAGRVVARDGTPVDPDGTLLGHPICPTGLVVSFG
ncbi:MAG TPA: hypothetical protein VNH13_02795 [Candidatus Acidoferrales bacterium]|nr:hypothetical protein [Candidatus Acidoferrales bacterium]